MRYLHCGSTDAAGRCRCGGTAMPVRKFAIHTLGTRGDVQPYIALALGILQAGYWVSIAAPKQFEGLVRSYGIEFSPLPGEFLDLLNRPAGKAAVAGGSGFAAGLKLLKHIRPHLRNLFDVELASARAVAPDVIIYHPKSLAAPHIAEYLKCPAILATPIPISTPTSDFASPIFPFGSMGPLNKVSHHLAMRIPTLLFGKELREWRVSSLKLDDRATPRYSPKGTLCAFSTEVIPKPVDWGEDVCISGFWFVNDRSWSPSGSLQEFLSNGPRPIYFGFGSMPGIDPLHLTRVILTALERTGNRGLLAIGGGALTITDRVPHVHFIDTAPHDQLFPHIQATVHHGGVGTVAASLRAGKPMAICPFLGDQPFWGRRIAEIKCGPKPLDRRRLTVETLTDAISAITSDSMKHHTSTVGERIRNERGVSEAVKFIERLIG